MSTPNQHPKPQLPSSPSMKDFQTYVHDLERFHGWLDVDLVHNCFLMGEEVGELFKAVRNYNRIFQEGQEAPTEARREHVGDEIVDVFNYLLAIANRLDIDVEAAFRRKNGINVTRTWT